jgi:hypothetical protein
MKKEKGSAGWYYPLTFCGAGLASKGIVLHRLINVILTLNEFIKLVKLYVYAS